MGVFYETIPQSLVEWVLAQKLFWVATAPLAASGHVNVSPKGGEYFGILDEKTFWYLDLTGSGVETISHLHEPGNGRITVMFVAFEGAPKIVRFWGRGRALENGSTEFKNFVGENSINIIPGGRSIVVVDIHQVGSSCGFSVPFYEFKDFRRTLNEFFEKKEEKFNAGNDKESMDRYWAAKNALSMDGMPGMKRGLIAGSRENVPPMKKMVGPRASQRYRVKSLLRTETMLLAVALGICAGVVMTVLVIMLVARFNPVMIERVWAVLKTRPSIAVTY